MLYLKEEIKNDDLQFGFTPNSSCSHAVFAITETILFYLTLNLTLFILFMEFSKAFDLLIKCKLFILLLGLINPNIWLMLATFYLIAKVVVRLGAKFSKYLKVKQGTKQGSPSSPLLFAKYIDGMIKLVVWSLLVVAISGVLTGIIVYADDTTIICSSIEDLRAVITLVETYCEIFGVRINTKKTKLMVVGPDSKRATEPITLCGEFVERVYSFKFLGFG